VVSVEKDVVEVLASHGNNHLGGDDFDQKIVDHVLAHLRDHSDIDPSDSRQAMARIVRAAEAAKIRLSTEPFARIEEEYLLEHEGRPLNLSLELARDDYEEMIRPYVDETLLAVHNAMESAGIGVRDLDEVLLVGGATRTPVIGRRLEEALGLLPRSELDPDLCVATGAAIQAGMIGGESVQTILVDVTPYTFGISGISDLNGEPYAHCFFPLIRRNTAIPVTRSEVFQTSYDNQDMVEIPVYQGEDPDALNNTEIGRFRVEGLRPQPAGNPVTATLALDINGILQVTASEKETGLSKTITIDNAISRFEGEQMDAARERVSALFESDQTEASPAESGHRREVVQARALVEKAEGLLEKASEDDRDDIVDLIEAINDAIAAESEKSLQQHMGDLSDLIYYLES
jgi:molecular chaperone DnaK (HSP70)